MSTIEQTIPMGNPDNPDVDGQNPNIGPDGLYTPAHVGKLFFESYRISQGGPDLQTKLFRYLSQRHGDHLSLELIDEGVKFVTPRILKFVRGGVNHLQASEKDASMSIADEQKTWKTEYKFRKPSISQVPYSPHETLMEILIRDQSMTEEERINRPDSSNTQSRSFDKYVSHFVFYGLLGKDTGTPEFNEMFTELVANLDKVPDTIPNPRGEHADPPVTWALPILEKHFKNYPGDLELITEEGMAALENRFTPEELQEIGITS